jgi:hypothetical protein
MSDVLMIDGCDEAILGYTEVGGQMVVIYGYEQLVEVFVDQFREAGDQGAQDEQEYNEGVEEQAVGWVDFNIVGAYLGPGTPLILYQGDREVISELAEILD